jgi:F-type H+-transporting ATPase subunit b
MVFVLNATLYRPINRVLQERENRTKGGRGSARDLLRRVEEGMNRYERTLREARAEGYHLMETARAEAMQERQRQLGAVRDEVSRILESEKATISAQTETVRAALTTDAQRIAAQIGEHLLHRPISNTTISYSSSLNT